MAMDYHSVPATSTAMERVFSAGRQLLNFMRNRLSGSSIRRFLCFGSWGRKNMVHMPDIEAAIRTLCKRKKDTNEERDESDVEMVDA
ncbi:hypothetical protein VNI00_017213 [Paramarasmius palmivorus]|uniref:HAT C-terminal dimerisation domain-containing protein n=1 Tax=Paramarasmius palmivorus TaxID=297713 RepID=A0AAW0B899_9AGAR